MSKTSPCRRATSAAGSTSALEPASSNRGLQTRYFKSTGATTEEIAPGDEADNCNKQTKNQAIVQEHHQLLTNQIVSLFDRMNNL